MPIDGASQVNEQQKRMKDSGTKSEESVGSMINDLANDTNFNISVTEDYAQGYPDMEKQFKMDYCVVFHNFDDTEWLIKSTSSIRTDRLYGTEFFAQNIRILDTEENKVDKIYVVVPDSLSDSEVKKIRGYSKKITSGTYKSFLTDVITINELRDLIIHKCMSEVSQGTRSNIIGKDTEKRVVQLLNDKGNWQLWNDFEHTKHKVKADTFQWFRVILTGIGAESSIGYDESKDPIIEIKATDDIPKLEGGGYPKTDVSFTITTQYRKNETYNISIKRTDKKQVTVHEGDISEICDALQLNADSQLGKALLAFQKYGSTMKLQESGNAVHVDVLHKELSKYNHKLVEYAIFGAHSARITHPAQVANCILYFDSTPSKECFWLRDDYITHYLANFVTRGNFGTPFQWTYPSKKLGKSIQLKGYTNN